MHTQSKNIIFRFLPTTSINLFFESSTSDREMLTFLGGGHHCEKSCMDISETITDVDSKNALMGILKLERLLKIIKSAPIDVLNFF